MYAGFLYEWGVKMTAREIMHYFDQKMYTVELSTTAKFYLPFKRMIDLFLGIVLMIPSLVIIGIFGLLIVMESKGGVFFRQERLGKDGRIIYVLKLRSMCNGAYRKGPLYTKENDHRVTKVGKFIRRTRIDELPQILNVLLGDMSFIGPRPLVPWEYEISDHEFANRLMVTPGISGLAQVNGGNDLNNNQKLVYDLEYIRDFGILMDLKVFILTLKTIISGNGVR